MSRTRLPFAVGLALRVGAAVRLVTLAIEPSLYIDEAMLALYRYRLPAASERPIVPPVVGDGTKRCAVTLP
jgi:hypothetical protein